MTAQTKAVLKSYFNTGDAPTEDQFGDLIDTIATPIIVTPTGVAATDTAALQAAVDLAELTGDTVKMEPGTFLLSAPIVINADGVILQGSGGTTLKLDAGAGAIKVIDADRVTIGSFAIDLNNLINTIGVYHLGGWYAHYSDILVNKATSPASAYGFKVESTDAGDGSSGSFVETFDNIVCNRIYLLGTAAKQVTTCTFTNLDCQNVIMTNVLAATFVQPVIQSNGVGNKLWDFTDVSGFSAIGGDYEGDGTVYNFNGAGNNGIFCFGNEIASSFTGTYKAGTVADCGYFMDFYPDSHFIENLTAGMPFGFHTNLLLSAVTAPQVQVRNAGYTNKGRFGVEYDGDIIHFTNNCDLISGAQCNLDDTAKWGFALTMGQTWAKMQYASNGANPRNLTTMQYWEYNQTTFYNNAIFGTGIGPVVTTPDGAHTYRLGVDNSGNVTSTLVT